MTQILHDPKSCMFSSTCAAGRRLDPPGPGLIKTIDSLRYRPACGGTSRRFFAATAGGGQFVCEMFAATDPRGPRPRRAGAGRRPRGTPRWRTRAFTADRHDAPAPAEGQRGDRVR